MFEEIDLSQFKVSDDEINGFSIANYNGVNFIYPNNNPKIFNYKEFCFQFSGRRFDIGEIFSCKTYKTIFDENGYTKSNTTTNIQYNSRNKSLFVKTQMILLLIHWINRYEFIKFFYKLITKKDFENDFINLNDYLINNWENEYAFCNYLGIHLLFDKNTNYVSIPQTIKACKESMGLDISDKSHHYSDKFTHSKELDGMKNKLEEIIKQPLLVDKFVKTSKTKFCHPKLLFILFDNVDSIKFINMCLEYHKFQNELDNEITNLPHIEFNLNNSITKKLNDNFALVSHLDMKIMIEIKTGYAHAKSTALKINPEKMKHIDRFMNMQDTIEFIKDLENDIKSKSFINLTNVENNFKGYYFHPDLFVYFIMWLDKKRAIKYIRLINIIGQASALRHKTLDYVILRENERLQKHIHELEELKQLHETKIDEQKNIISEQQETIDNLNQILLKLIQIKDQ